MNNSIKIVEDIYWLGVNDRETHIFESLWPLPDGVAYNSYLIVDEKVALIDTVSINYSGLYLEKIKNILGDRGIDYLIINHMEPDHSGSVRVLKEVYPDLKIIGNQKTAEFLEGFYGITEGVRVVSEGEEIELGNHTLKFFLTPMLHWPETMMTFIKEKNILFSGDAFGSFGSLNGGIFDDEVDYRAYREETRRYFASIVGKYSPMVLKALNKLSTLEVSMIAATHGLIWRKNPGYIIDLYKKWSSYEAEDGVVIAYGSMYGNTKLMAEEIARGFAEEGIQEIEIFDVSRRDLSFILSAIWRYKGLVLGSCTYNTELFPPVRNLVEALKNRGLKKRLLGIFGTYSWSGGAVTGLEKFADSMKFNLIKPVVEAEHSPATERLEDCRKIARNMVSHF